MTSSYSGVKKCLKEHGIELPEDCKKRLSKAFMATDVRYKVTEEVLNSIIKTYNIWSTYMSDKEKDKPNFIVRQIIGYLKIGCAVVSNEPNLKSYIGKCVRVNMPEYKEYMATIVKTKGNLIVKTKGNHIVI